MINWFVDITTSDGAEHTYGPYQQSPLNNGVQIGQGPLVITDPNNGEITIFNTESWQSVKLRQQQQTVVTARKAQRR